MYCHIGWSRDAFKFKMLKCSTLLELTSDPLLNSLFLGTSSF